MLWSSDGISTSGSPPVEIASVPPAFPADDSVPTQPHAKSAQRSPAYLIAAMSNPHRESVESVSVSPRGSRLQPAPSRSRPRVIEPHRTLRLQPQWYPAHAQAARGA